QKVYRVSEEIQEEKCTDNGDGHRNSGNQRRPEVLKEDKYNEKYENESFDECSDNLRNRRIEELVGVKVHRHFQTARELLLEIIDRLVNIFDNLLRIGTRSLVNTHTYAGQVVRVGNSTVTLGVKLNLRDV